MIFIIKLAELSFFVFFCIKLDGMESAKCETCSMRLKNPLKSLTKDLDQKPHCKTTKFIKKGEVIFDEGEHVNGIYCVHEGVCKVSKMSENGREQIIHLIKSGDLLGERNLISNECANLKSTAITDMEVCFIPRDEIMNHLNTNNDFTIDMLKHMASILKNTDNNLVNLGQKNVKQRLAYTLIYLDNRFGKREDGTININLSREDIANILGTTTETTIRLISEFKKKGFIELKNKKIKILSEQELKRLSLGD